METKKLPEAYQTISETMQLIQDMKSELDFMRRIVFSYYRNYGELLNNHEFGSFERQRTEHISDLKFCHIWEKINIEKGSMKVILSNNYTIDNMYFKICEKIKKLT